MGDLHPSAPWASRTSSTSGNLPPRVSSIFQPILGRRIHGPIGKFIDVVAIIGTVFGVAVSIGLGVLQINGGLEQLVGIPQNAGWQLIIIGSRLPASR